MDFQSPAFRITTLVLGYIFFCWSEDIWHVNSLMFQEAERALVERSCRNSKKSSGLQLIETAGAWWRAEPLVHLRSFDVTGAAFTPRTPGLEWLASFSESLPATVTGAWFQVHLERYVEWTTQECNKDSKGNTVCTTETHEEWQSIESDTNLRSVKVYAPQAFIGDFLLQNISRDLLPEHRVPLQEPGRPSSSTTTLHPSSWWERLTRTENYSSYNMKMHNDKLYSHNPFYPSDGDLKMWFTYAGGNVSVLGAVKSQRLEKWTSTVQGHLLVRPKKILLVDEGSISARDMVSQERGSSWLNLWLRRIAGVVVCLAGSTGGFKDCSWQTLSIPLAALAICIGASRAFFVAPSAVAMVGLAVLGLALIAYRRAQGVASSGGSPPAAPPGYIRLADEGGAAHTESAAHGQTESANQGQTALPPFIKQLAMGGILGLAAALGVAFVFALLT